MANDLTGEFDVVAEFAIPAANRVLASMHRGERFLHSISTRVDDTGTRSPHGSIVGAIEELGAALANHERIVDSPSGPRQPLSPAAFLLFDDIVNFGGVIQQVPIEPSLLKGKAQVQLFPPTLEVPDNSGTRLTVKIPILSRYFPDPQTSPLAQYVRGEIQLTAPINQVVTQDARVVEIDLKSPNVQIGFSTTFSSRPLSADDIAGVSLLLRNALKNSFLPSNAMLPSKIAHIQFKTLRPGTSALAVLLNMSGGAGNPASLGQIFLGGGDDFAFGVGVDFLKASFQPTLDRILSQPIDPVRFDIDTWVYTAHITYTITLNGASLDLQAGKMVLTIRGHAHTPTSWLPDFDFTVKQDLTLAVDGATANLVLGELSLDTDSFIADRFKGGAISSMTRVRDRALAQSNVQQTVRTMLSADENLGGFLTGLLNPPTTGPTTPPQERPRLSYTAAEIRPSGIVLHGAIAVPDFPPPHVEYEQIPPADLGPISDTVLSGTDYSALNSWIPGGVVERYEWSRFGVAGSTRVETNRFIFEDRPDIVATDGGGGVTSVGDAVIVADPPVTAVIPGYHPLCLTVRGSRLSASGPVVAQPVSGVSCGFNAFPVATSADFTTLAKAPLVALPHAGAGGRLEVTGHTPARVDPSNTRVPNRLVHFADDTSAAGLDGLVAALLESKRTDAVTAVIAVLTSAQLASARFVAGVTYADDENGAWSKLYRAGKTRPLTLVLGPKGNELWRYEGYLERRALVEALRRSLTARPPLRVHTLPASVRIGLPPPNLLFPYAPGRELTLRKLGGRPATLVFWRSDSPASIEAVRDAGRATDPTRNGIVIAINDGEPPDLAARAFAAHKLTASLVTDPDRAVAQAYRVQIWPTTVVVDGRGLVTRVAAGRDMTIEDGAGAAGR